MLFMPSTKQCPDLRQAEAIKASVSDLQRTRPKSSMRNALSLGRDPCRQNFLIILVVSLHIVRESPPTPSP